MRTGYLFHPLRALTGYRLLKGRQSDGERLLELCRTGGVTLLGSEPRDDGIYLLCPFFSSGKLISLAAKASMPLEVVASYGLPALLARYRRRYGAALGLLVSALLLLLSGSVIWEISVDGAVSLSESEVIDVLDECGLSLGTLRRSVDIDALENRVLIYSDDIAWISVNIIGTSAEVEIREVALPERDEEEDPPIASNIVAARSGRIVSFENISGNISADIGETVSEGQLLIGGIYGDEESGFRYKRAEGRVMAEVEREFSIEIPRTEQQKVYSERKIYEKYLIFFKKRIKFFSNYRNLPMSCDKIDIEEFLPAPNGKELPVGVQTVRYSEYSYEGVTRTDEELLALGYLRLEALLADALSGAELLSKQTETEIYEDRLVLSCRVRCIEDIACEREIEIDGLP